MRRMRGDRGAAMVTGIVLLFAFTSLGVIWLARDVDRAVANRSSAQAIAFQAARSGAQAIDVDAIRAGGAQGAVVGEAAAIDAATRAAARLFDSYGVDGTVTAVAVDGPQVTVTVQLRDRGRVVSGIGGARAQERS